MVGSTVKRLAPGIYVVRYKLGDDIPFNEELLNELTVESARALGIAARSAPTQGVSVLPVCNMSNCVVNAYVKKEGVPFGQCKL
ncbi:hypothetical protein GOP47_0018064 [Adiantum capillus-veneris]|uniref:Uncharacterized protein n=1 Tax=Adiantum capillus-veneris TaxID=13818 RepID=A0A9D4UGM0_ADICA|nr:hypothetical protein GOP47_0018064 [Adiantum capillus-veneris]